nr:immunoglobulin light chain junction region [Macaca mulatta]
CHNGYGYPLTF